MESTRWPQACRLWRTAGAQWNAELLALDPLRDSLAPDDTAIVEAIAVICDEFECYGRRRVQATVRQQGVVVNSPSPRADRAM